MFTAAVDVSSDIGTWEQGGLTVSLPGVLEHDSATVLDAEADQVTTTPAALHGGGFDFIARRSDLRVGRRISIRARVRVRADASPGTVEGTMDAVAFNEVVDRRFLELGIAKIRFQVR